MTNCAGRHLQLFLSWLPAPEMAQAEAQGSLHTRGVPQKSGTLSMECAIYIHKQRMGTELAHGWPTPPLMISETSSLPNWPEAGCWKGEPKVATYPPSDASCDCVKGSSQTLHERVRAQSQQTSPGKLGQIIAG